MARGERETKEERRGGRVQVVRRRKEERKRDGEGRDRIQLSQQKTHAPCTTHARTHTVVTTPTFKGALMRRAMEADSRGVR